MASRSKRWNSQMYPWLIGRCVFGFGFGEVVGESGWVWIRPNWSIFDPFPSFCCFGFFLTWHFLQNLQPMGAQEPLEKLATPKKERGYRNHPEVFPGYWGIPGQVRCRWIAVGLPSNLGPQTPWNLQWTKGTYLVIQSDLFGMVKWPF